MGHTCEVIWGQNWWLGTHIFLYNGYSYTSVKLQYSGRLKDQEHFHNHRLIHRVVGMLVGACTLYSTSTAFSKRSPLATLSLRPQERFAPCTALSSVAGHQRERGRGECDGPPMSRHTHLCPCRPLEASPSLLLHCARDFYFLPRPGRGAGSPCVVVHG